MRFQLDQHTDSSGEVTEESPRFMAFRDCKHWWRVMTELREDEKNPEDVDTKQEDHHYDCTRYAFMCRPLTPQIKPREAPGSFQAERARFIRAKKLAQTRGISIAAAYARTR
jgi:hypothetical protein